MELKRRVGDLEGAVNVLAGQLGSIQPELGKLRHTSAERFDRIEDLVGKVVGRMDLLNTQIWSLRDDLPSMLVDALQRESRQNS